MHMNHGKRYAWLNYNIAILFKIKLLEAVFRFLVYLHIFQIWLYLTSIYFPVADKFLLHFQDVDMCAVQNFEKMQHSISGNGDGIIELVFYFSG